MRGVHGHLVVVLHAPVQLPRDQVFRHRRQGHRPAFARHDQPCGKIRIPINESADDKSQIEEFIKQYNGEGIQHIALGTDDIYQTVRALMHAGYRCRTPSPPTMTWSNAASPAMARTWLPCVN
jgi:hypothetical protein